MNEHFNHNPGCSLGVCERWSVAILAAVPADVQQALVVAPSLSAITRTSQ